MKSFTEIDHRCTDEIVCPYCGKEYSDSHEFFESHQDSGETECDDCGKEFFYSRDFSVTYYTSKKSCNDLQDCIKDMDRTGYTSPENDAP